MPVDTARYDLSQHRRVRVALVSDTHGHLDERVADLVSGCDLAVHAGDVGDARVLAALQTHAGALVAVRGNNDTLEKWPSAQHAGLRALPEQGLVSLPGGLLVVLHGDRYDPVAQRHAKLRAVFKTARTVVYGHSHRQVFDCSAHPWVINPGAAGRARTFDGPSCTLLEAAASAWRVSEHRFPKQ